MRGFGARLGGIRQGQLSLTATWGSKVQGLGSAGQWWVMLEPSLVIPSSDETRCSKRFAILCDSILIFGFQATWEDVDAPPAVAGTAVEP